MLSLLLELVLIRWLASVFPVFAFYKNFTMLACFLGLGAGYAVAEKQPCAPALVLPMLALFVGVITLLRYDTGGGHLIFSIGWLSTFDLPVYFLLGASFILCACICYPVGQLCGKLLHSSNSLKAYSLNLIGSILGVIALFVMSLYLAAAGDLVRGGRRHDAAVRAAARRLPAAWASQASAPCWRSWPGRCSRRRSGSIRRTSCWSAPRRPKD